MPRCPACFRRVAANRPCPADGITVPPSVSPPAAPPQHRAYRIEERLGGGGSADVYRAWGPEQRPVALKVGRGTADATRERLCREAAIQHRLGPSLAPSPVEMGELADGRPYLAMELIEVPMLSDELGELEQRPSADWAVVRARRIATLLRDLHRHDLVHGDLKPENLTLVDRDRPLLLDFGTAVPVGTIGAAAGTVEYAAPEILRGEPLDQRADLYSLGVILFELLSLRPPFVGDYATIHRGHLALRPLRLGDLTPVAASLEDLIADCLAKDPRLRPQSAAVIIERLDQARGDTRPEVRRSHPRPAAREPGQVPVVLLAVRGPIAVNQFQSAVGRRGGVMLGQRNGHLLAGFSSATVARENPVDVAIECGRALTDQVDAGALVHVTSAHVRGGRRGWRIHGKAVSEPDWLRRVDAGVHVTDQARRAVPEIAVQSDGDHHRVLDRESRATAVAGEPTLVGRGDLLGRVRDEAQMVARHRRAAMVVIEGAGGSGRSRIARAAGQLLADLGFDLLQYHGQRPLGDSEQLLPRALRDALGLEDVGSPVDPAAALRATLGDLADDLLPAVAPALGWRTLTLAALSPKALRDGTVRALAVGLRQRSKQRRLAMIIDDADDANDAVLEALVTATADDDQHPLLVVLIGGAGMRAMQDAWRRRIGNFCCLPLPPLAEDDADALIRELLMPATGIAQPIVERLRQWCGGNPALISDLIRTLRRENIIRPMPGSDVWFVAASELDRLPETPSRPWLAGRELAALSADQAAFLQIASCVGYEVSLAELETICVDRLDDGLVLEPVVGLAELHALGFLQQIAVDRYRFRSAVLHEAIYESTAAGLRSDIHRRTFDYWRRLPGEVSEERLHRLAYHAAAAGLRDEAFAHHNALAEAARAQYSCNEAERHYTAALEQLSESDARVRMTVLFARGQIRHLLTHYEDARADFQGSRALACQFDDQIMRVESLLAEAAACDNTEAHLEAARLVDLVLVEAPRLPAAVQARLWNRVGVVRSRQQRVEEAIEHLDMAQSIATSVGDLETRIGCLLLLGRLMARSGRAAEGLEVLSQAIAVSEQAGDWFHLVTGLLNRHNHYYETGELARAHADADRGMRIAREMGYQQLEIWLAFNSSIRSWWAGQMDAALSLAERAHVLSLRRFRDRPNYTGTVQYALTLAVMDRVAEVRSLMDRLHGGELRGTAYEGALRMLELFADDDDGPEWDRIEADVRAEGQPQEIVEMLWIRARCCLRRNDRAKGQALLETAIREARERGGGVSNVLELELGRILDRGCERSRAESLSGNA